jgi:hypothetical protein
MRIERAVQANLHLMPSQAAISPSGGQSAFNKPAPLSSVSMGEWLEFPREQVGGSARTNTEASSPTAGETLQCVGAHNFQEDGRSCGACVPLAVMRAAWKRELDRGRSGDGFFHFAWRDQVWLGFGLEDGEVRGVYCPVHRAQREERLGYDPELGDPTSENTER